MKDLNFWGVPRTALAANVWCWLLTRRNAGGFEVFTHGGRTPTGIDAIEWAKDAAARGAGEILLTSMDGDGTKDGYDLELTRAVSDAVPIPVIASGGAGNADHMANVIDGHASAVLPLQFSILVS